MPRHPAPAPDDRARRLPRAVLWDMDGTLVDLSLIHISEPTRPY